jgi:hypothetical protein
MVAFWGERYRNYFLRFLLPLLLASNNLPLLRLLTPQASDRHD